MAAVKKPAAKKVPNTALPKNAFQGQLNLGGGALSGGVYVWHGKDSQESAEALAAELGGRAGTLPPKGFKGHLVCLSPGVSEKFKWDEREFATIVNDPRKGFKKTPEEQEPVLGKAARLYCVSSGSGKTAAFSVWIRFGDGGIAEVPAVSGVFSAARTTVTELGQPQLVALDGVVSRLDQAGNVVQASQFIPTKVIYAPSLTTAAPVREAIKKMVPTKKAKERLTELVAGSSEEEADALYRLLGRLSADPKMMEQVVGE